MSQNVFGWLALSIALAATCWITAFVALSDGEPGSIAFARRAARAGFLAPLWPLLVVGAVAWAMWKILQLSLPQPAPASEDPILEAARREVDAIAPQDTDLP